MRVAVGRQHLEDTVLHAQDRDVEGAAPQVVHRDGAAVARVEAVGERRGRRLVDDAEHFEARQTAGVACGRALRVVEVRRHRDDRAIDLEIELALLAEMLLGPVLELLQDERRDLRRRELSIADTQPDDTAGITGDPKPQELRIVDHVLHATAHEPLHRVHRPCGSGEEASLGLAADEHRAGLVERHDRRHERVAGGVADHDRLPALCVGYEAVGGAEIDADNFTHGLRSSYSDLRARSLEAGAWSQYRPPLDRSWPAGC